MKKKLIISFSIAILVVAVLFVLKTNAFLSLNNNSSTDQDSNLIQQLINKAAAGDTIYIPKGTYRINEALLIEKSILLIGCDTVSIINTSGDENGIVLHQCNSTLRNIRICCDTSIFKQMSGTVSLIRITDCDSVLIDNCEIFAAAIGVDGEWEHLTVKNSYLHHNYICALYDDGLELLDSSASKKITFINTRFEYNGAPITQQQIDDNNGILCEIENFSASGSAGEIKQAWIYTERNEELVLLFKNHDYFYPKAKLVGNFMFATCSYPDASFFNDTIVLSCVNSNGYEAKTVLRYKNNQLTTLYDTLIDSNQSIKDEAEAAFANKNPIAYLHCFDGAQWYEQFLPSEAERALHLADSMCSVYVKTGNYRKAAQLMDSLETAFDYTTTATVLSDCSQIWIRAASYYVNAQMPQACIRLCQRLENERISSADMLLYYGDALYAINSKTEACEKYKQYLKTTDNKNIPPRVNSRCAECVN